MSQTISNEEASNCGDKIYNIVNHIVSASGGGPYPYGVVSDSKRYVRYLLAKYLEPIDWYKIPAPSTHGEVSREALDQIWQGWCAKGLNQSIETTSHKSLFKQSISTKSISYGQYKEQYDRVISQDTELRQQDAQIKQLQTELKQQSDTIKQQEDTIKMQVDQLKQQENQLRQRQDIINQQAKHLTEQEIQLKQQSKHLMEQADQLTEQAEWIKQYNAKELNVNQLTTQLADLSTQMIGIQPDLLQLSDLYYEQQSKSISLEVQLAEQEDNIKQLLAALEANQSKQGLASVISSYFK